MASGTIPTSKFLPNHGGTSISRCAILLKSPFARIQPPWRPIGNQSEHVLTRASARTRPMRKSVVNPAASKRGSANCEKEYAMELKPEVQVTIADVCCGAFKKCTIEEKADVTKIDTYLPLLRHKIHRRNTR